MMRGLLGAALLAAASSAVLPAQAQIQTAHVTGGLVEGTLAHGIVAFKGIPFAAPPVGALRWRSPQPVVPWRGTRSADRFGASCMQDPMFARIMGAPPALSEDCLYLNLWTPAKSPRARLPVMVWIYGGGFVGGMTSVPVYDGTHFAQQGVVLVSIAYRLGVFGFLADPQLSRESGHGSGNYGLEDMIAGLKWVRANIAKFGGDPSRVTVFGESAGGIAVSMLAVSPPAKGLFARAISESGGSLAPPRYDPAVAGENVRPLALAERAGERFLAKLGARDIAAARALDAQVLQKALGAGLQGGFWPVLDGFVLPGDAYTLYQRGRFNDTPVLVGTNSDEGSLFVGPGVTPETFAAQVRAGYGSHAQAILAVYPHASAPQAEQSARDLMRDTTFAWGTWAWARLQSQHGRGSAYVYYFDHRTPQFPNGPSHAAELGYVFATLGGPGGGPAGLTGPPRPEDLALSALMQRYWVNFARTGDPNGPGLPTWPAFRSGAQRAMYLDAQSGAHRMPNLKQLEALDAYFAWRRAAARAHGQD